MCRAHDETSTYAKPHMKMNTGHTRTRVCVDCVGKDTRIAVTTKAQIESTPKCAAALTHSASESAYVYMRIGRLFGIQV